MIHLILKTTKFIPNEYHHEFDDIDFEQLYKNGYRLILTDLDNTLISYEEDKATDEIISKITKLQAIGFEVKIVSNNVTSRINTFVEGLNIDGFANARKPLSIGFKKAVKSAENQVPRENVIIIGDQLMTDIYGANRFKAYSILVDPIKRKTEKWYTKMNRRVEEKMIVKIQKKYPNVYNRLNLSKRG